MFGLLPAVNAKETVVLLHGLLKSSKSMAKMERALVEEGYEVVNIDYPSRDFPVEELASFVRELVVIQTGSAEQVHVVTHSMGGIVLRYIQQNFPIENIGRVVMLSPPNQGSEVTDALGDWALFEWVTGPAGLQLGTGEESMAAALKPVDFELGVITGDRSVNWVMSGMIPGSDDGKVSVVSAQVEGMQDFRVYHVSHPFIMKRKAVIEDVITFLDVGKFANPRPEKRRHRHFGKSQYLRW